LRWRKEEHCIHKTQGGEQFPSPRFTEQILGPKRDWNKGIVSGLLRGRERERWILVGKGKHLVEKKKKREGKNGGRNPQKYRRNIVSASHNRRTSKTTKPHSDQPFGRKCEGGKGSNLDRGGEFGDTFHSRILMGET